MSRRLTRSGYAAAVHRLLTRWRSSRAAVTRLEGYDVEVVEDARAHLAVIAGPAEDPVAEARAYVTAAEILLQEADRALSADGALVYLVDWDEVDEEIERVGEGT